jgi:hypothetical protein
MEIRGREIEKMQWNSSKLFMRMELMFGSFQNS